MQDSSKSEKMILNQDECIQALIQIPDRITNSLESIQRMERLVRQQNQSIHDIQNSLHRICMDPVFYDLICLHDEIEKAARSAKKTKEDSPSQSPEDHLAVLECLAKELEILLKRHGAAPTAEAGNAFDANLHRIAGMQSDQEREGQILEVQRQGFVFEGRVLRYADVVVASKEGAG